MSVPKMRIFKKISNKTYSLKLDKTLNKPTSEITITLDTFNKFIDVESRMFNEIHSSIVIKSSSNSFFFDYDKLKKSYPNSSDKDINYKKEKNNYRKMITIYSNMVLNDILKVLDEDRVKFILDDDNLSNVLSDIKKIIDRFVVFLLFEDMNKSYLDSMKYVMTNSQYEQYVNEINRGMRIVIPIDGNIKNTNASNLLLVNNFDMYPFDEVYNRIVRCYTNHEIKSACLMQHSGNMKILI